MTIKHPNQKQTLQAAVGLESLAVKSAELSNQENLDRPCHVYSGLFQDVGKAYLQLNGGQDG